MKTTSKPLVSVILPTHNRPNLLIEAIQSVCDQTINDFELIIVDDASEPKVDESELKKQFDINFHVQRNAVSQGGAESKNIGASHAKGKYLVFLDDDDKLAPTYLQQATELLDNESNADLVFMGVFWFGLNAANGEKNYNSAMKKVYDLAKPRFINNHFYLFDELLVKALLQTVPMAFQRPVTSAETFHSIGNYDKNCLLWDCDWALRASLQARCALIPSGLYYQRADNQGFSSVNRILDQMYSGVYFKEKLINEIEQHDNKKLKQLLKQVLAQGWFDLAYYLKKYDKIKALKAWYKSQRYELNLKRSTFIFKLLFY